MWFHCWSCAHPFFTAKIIYDWVSPKLSFVKVVLWKEKVAAIHFRKIIQNVHQHIISSWILIDPKNTLFYFHDHVWLRFIKTESLLFHSWVDRIDLICLGQILSFHFKFLYQINNTREVKICLRYSLLFITFWFDFRQHWNEILHLEMILNPDDFELVLFSIYQKLSF